MGHPHDHGHSDHHAHVGHVGHVGHAPHGADPRSGRDARALRLALVLTVLLLVGEGIGGWLSNSLALLADAGHVLTDAGALGLSLFVAWFCGQPASEKKTFGYLRWEILAALVNGATLLGISAWILVEAILRLRTPEPVHGSLMLGVAVVGLAVNAVAALILHGAHGDSLNVRGAYLHVVGDLLASVGTVVAAVIIQWTGWLMADPLASLLSTALIMRGALSLVRESVDVLLEGAPRHIPLDDVRARLESIPGVQSVHDLHVWTVTSGLVAASAHALVPDSALHQRVLEHAHAVLQDMGIQHVTVQIEQEALGNLEAEHLHS